MRKIIITLFLATLAGPAVAAECFDESTNDPKAGEATAVVGPDVGVMRLSGADFLRPDTGDDMFAGDYVRTGDESLLQLKLCDWSTYTFSPNSESSIADFYDPATASGGRVVNYARGGMRYSSGRDTEPGTTEVEIQETGVTMGVRGTNVIIAEIDGVIYALLEGPLRDNNGLEPRGLVDFWTDGNRSAIAARLKRPGFAVRIGADGVSEPFRADDALLRKIYRAFLPVIPEDDGAIFTDDPRGHSGQGAQDGRFYSDFIGDENRRDDDYGFQDPENPDNQGRRGQILDDFYNDLALDPSTGQ